MKKIYNIFNSIIKSFIKLFKRNTDQQVTVEIKEVREDQVPKEIREQIEAKERELRKEEAQM